MFDPGTAEDLAERLVRLLTEAVAHPERPVRELGLLSAAERDAVLHRVNATDREVGPAVLPDLLRGGAETAGDAPAVVFQGTAVSRAEFDGRVARLARELAARGAGPESVVAVALPRSVELVVALHAVVQAGAAYLPLDTELPADRLAGMIADAAPLCAVCDEETARLLPQAPGWSWSPRTPARPPGAPRSRCRMRIGGGGCCRSIPRTSFSRRVRRGVRRVWRCRTGRS
ncbi:AMP-binding protein [Nocardiopsis composta]